MAKCKANKKKESHTKGLWRNGGSYRLKHVGYMNLRDTKHLTHLFYAASSKKNHNNKTKHTKKPGKEQWVEYVYCVEQHKAIKHETFSAPVWSVAYINTLMLIRYPFYSNSSLTGTSTTYMLQELNGLFIFNGRSLQWRRKGFFWSSGQWSLCCAPSVHFCWTLKKKKEKKMFIAALT